MNSIYICLLIEFAEAYLMLIHYPTTSVNGVTFRDRLNYILDQHNSMPGKRNYFSSYSDAFLFLNICSQVLSHVNKVNVFSIVSIDTASQCF